MTIPSNYGLIIHTLSSKPKISFLIPMLFVSEKIFYIYQFNQEREAGGPFMGLSLYHQEGAEMDIKSCKENEGEWKIERYWNAECKFRRSKKKYCKCVHNCQALSISLYLWEIKIELTLWPLSTTTKTTITFLRTLELTYTQVW